MPRCYYAKENAEFGKIVASEQARPFRPRFHFLYSEREAEQDAFWWFMKGQQLVLDQLNSETDTESGGDS